MNISGISKGASQAAPAHAGTAMDAESRNIQKQITDAQKQLQEVSANGELSADEKVKKRQEIQKEISDLKMQLRQHQIEVKKQEQEEKKASRESAPASKQQEKGQGNGMPSAGMQAVISADASLKQAEIQNNTAKSLEGRAGVLEAEIKQDGGGAGTEAKQAQLAGIRQRASEAEASGMKTLKEAGRALQEASKTEPESGIKEASRAEKEDKKAEGEDGADTERTNGENADGRAEKNTETPPGTYVDVRL